MFEGSSPQDGSLETISASQPTDAQDLTQASSTLARKFAERRGINKHTEHLADMVLDLAPGAESGTLPSYQGFQGFVTDLMDQIAAKQLDCVNEKFDGSPALVLGYDHEGKPFVAYKHGLGTGRGQRIVTSVADARAQFPEGSFMGEILADGIRFLRQRLGTYQTKDVIFQADLLFTPHNGAKQTLANGDISIQPNEFGVEYRLETGSKYHRFARDARIGLVVHSAFKREFHPETGLVQEGESISDPTVVEKFVTSIRSRSVFAIDPWSKRVNLEYEGARDFPAGKEHRLKREMTETQSGLQTLSPEFRQKWAKLMKPFLQFMNTSLKAGRGGGLFQAAADEDPFRYQHLVEKFLEWAEQKSNRWVAQRSGRSRELPLRVFTDFKELVEKHSPELYLTLKAFYDANRLLAELKPFLSPLYRSKLGGGKIEGVMLSDESTLVKLVDRLDFTRGNFAGEKERRRQARARYRERIQETAKRTQVRDTKPSPFEQWQPGAIFIIGKYQPPHAGHIDFIKAVRDQAGGAPVYVIASNKQPDLSAEKWREMGVHAGKSNKSDLQSAKYDRVFSVDFRADCFRQAFGDELEGIHFLSPRDFWSYVRAAKDQEQPGKVKLAMGQKEIDEGTYASELARYGSHVESLPVAMKADGISGTEVKAALKNLVLFGDAGSYEFLKDAFRYMNTAERNLYIYRAYRAWLEVHEEVQDRL